MIMGKKYPRVKELESTGFSEWIAPTHKKYQMACCDCGLVHELQFKITREGYKNAKGEWNMLPTKVKKLRVLFRARRNKRATGQMRRWMKNDNKST